MSSKPWEKQTFPPAKRWKAHVNLWRTDHPTSKQSGEHIFHKAAK